MFDRVVNALLDSVQQHLSLLFLRIWNCKSVFLILKSGSMADRGGEFNIFQGIHARFDVRNDLSKSIRPMITKFSKQVHLQDLTQMRIIKQVPVTSLRQDHVTN